MNIKKVSISVIFSYFFAIKVLYASADSRFNYYDPFSNGFLAKPVASVNVLIAEDLTKKLHNVIVTIVFSETKLPELIDTYCLGLRSGEIIVEKEISIPDFISRNIEVKQAKYVNRNETTAFVFANEQDIQINTLKESFRIRSDDNGSPYKDNKLFCVGFSLADGQVQISDFETIKQRTCPNHIKENDDEVFYKTFFTKPILAIDAMRIIQKGLKDQLQPKISTFFGYNKPSHAYAISLLRAGNLNFPKYLGGWGPAFDYPFISDMTSFLRKIDYADDTDWYENRHKLKGLLTKETTLSIRMEAIS